MLDSELIEKNGRLDWNLMSPFWSLFCLRGGGGWGWESSADMRHPSVDIMEGQPEYGSIPEDSPAEAWEP